ncbi:MAG: 4Fe-4S dicluster domain-containing protein [Acetobacteraceae bacterium]
MNDPGSKPDILLRRRAALGLLASGALLPLTGCDKPEEEIRPYVKMPESLVPGVPLRFATCMPLSGFGRGMLVTSWQGRPSKVEGNPAHPASLGATDVFAEASVLQLYDPDRSRTVRLQQRLRGMALAPGRAPAAANPQALRSGKWPASWDGFLAALLPRLTALEAKQGEGLRIVTGNLTSPTLLRLLEEVRGRFPRMRHYQHEPIGENNARDGMTQAFGRPLRALPHLDRAAVVVALDADPLGSGPDQMRMGRGFAAQRTVRNDHVSFARLYALEPVMTTTGAKADHRLALTPDQVRAVATALAAALGAPVSPPALDAATARWVQVMARDLLAHPGEALVLTGVWQPPEVHALVAWMNDRLRAPVDYIAPPELPAEPPGTVADLVRDLRAAESDGVLCLLGTNPVYDAPAALGVAEVIRNAAFSVHMGLWLDETAAYCDWHLPESHWLEHWGDLRAPDGTAAIIQPLIRPLHATRPAAWLLGALNGRLDLSDYAAVRATWAARHPEDFETWWRRVLHDGVILGTAAEPIIVTAPDLPDLGSAAAPETPIQSPPPAPATEPLILALRPDASVWDGRYANNAWLQECPRPLTSQVWGNAAIMAPRDAALRGIRQGDPVRLTLDGRSVVAPALVQAGHAPGVVMLTLGYGRRQAGAIGNDIGVDAYVLRSPDRPWYSPGLAVTPAEADPELLLLQVHQQLDARQEDIVPTMTLDEWRHHAEPPDNVPPPPSLYPRLLPDDTRAWSMVIDNTRCIGCNACVIACQAENNVPIVGPEEIAMNRDMHWLRIDTYDLGSPAAPRPAFAPVPCMHCEKAPCEPVCPVAASVHDAEGLNVQVYNRCIGTRFCQSNCPYKVRRFNFFSYAGNQAYANMGDELVMARRNPDVSVRARGVMEKCTYCVQRITGARRAAERENRDVAEGEVVTACQSACPTHAIQFGDLRGPDSRVARLHNEKHHYAMLGHLGTRPRTTYLADIRNPDPDLET